MHSVFMKLINLFASCGKSYVWVIPLAHAGYHRHNSCMGTECNNLPPHPGALSTSQVYSWSCDVFTIKSCFLRDV